MPPHDLHSLFIDQQSKAPALGLLSKAEAQTKIREMIQLSQPLPDYYRPCSTIELELPVNALMPIVTPHVKRKQKPILSSKELTAILTEHGVISIYALQWLGIEHGGYIIAPKRDRHQHHLLMNLLCIENLLSASGVATNWLQKCIAERNIPPYASNQARIVARGPHSITVTLDVYVVDSLLLTDSRK